MTDNIKVGMKRVLLVFATPYKLVKMRAHTDNEGEMSGCKKNIDLHL